MKNLLTIVRWSIVLPVLFLEAILKGLTFVILLITLIIMAIFFPIFRTFWYQIDTSYPFKYATKWEHTYPLAKKVFNLWQ